MKLKPCPLCEITGGNSCTVEKTKSGKLFFWHCWNCGMSGPCEQNSEDAIKVFNALPRRDPLARHKDRVMRAAIAKLECKKGYQLGDLAVAIEKFHKAKSSLRKRK